MDSLSWEALSKDAVPSRCYDWKVSHWKKRSTKQADRAKRWTQKGWDPWEKTACQKHLSPQCKGSQGASMMPTCRGISQPLEHLECWLVPKGKATTAPLMNTCFTWSRKIEESKAGSSTSFSYQLGDLRPTAASWSSVTWKAQTARISAGKWWPRIWCSSSSFPAAFMLAGHTALYTAASPTAPSIGPCTE